MNVKQLKVYCTEKINMSDIETLQCFMQKQKRKAGKTICCNAVVLIGFALALTIFICAFSGKFSLEMLKNIAPFYLFFSFFIIIVAFGLTIKTTRISARLKQAMKEGTGIAVSKQNYLLYSVDTEHIAWNDSDHDSSTFYHFSREDNSSIRFHVGSRQTGCCFDEMKSGAYYKLYCICEKNIFFVKSKD